MEPGEEARKRISLVVIGHVDAGKSSCVGQLLLQSGAVSARDAQRAESAARAENKASFKLAFLTDKSSAERSRGVTIETSLHKFSTPRFDFNILDAPGHRDYLKNAITGVAQADVAMLIVAAGTGEFEAGLSRQGSTREHMLLAFTLGVKQIIVAVNKMDAASWSEERFDEIRDTVRLELKKVGYKPAKVTFVPISAFNGHNVGQRYEADDAAWYSGPTLLEALDAVREPKRPTDKPLRIPVADVYNIRGVGAVIAGRVETGVISARQAVVAAPGGASGQVRSIEVHHEDRPFAAVGESIGFNVSGVSKADVRRGDVVGPAGEDRPVAAESFVAQIVVVNHPGAIRAGYQPTVDIHTAHVACRFQELLQLVDRRTGEVKEESPEALRQGDAALVRLVPIRPVVVEAFADYAPLGRFVVRDGSATVAVGVVREVARRAAA